MEIVRLTTTSIDSAARRAAQVLAKGGIVLYPTDTLYGLAVDATNPRAIERLRSLKQREAKKPIAVIMPSVDVISRYAVMNEVAYSLATRFLPGPLTLVLPVTAQMPMSITLNGAMGVRIPNDPFCQALSNIFPKPYTTTSANKAGRTTPHAVPHILEHFGKDIVLIDMVIDDGERGGGVPSTVVTCVAETPYILRHGQISKEDVFEQNTGNI